MTILLLLQYFLNSFNENPEYSTAIYNAGNAAYLDGNFESAREYYDQYINTIENKNEKAEALHNIGNTTQVVAAGDKIAQLVMVPVIAFRPMEADEEELYEETITISDRGDGALGSTDEPPLPHPLDGMPSGF